MSENEKQVIDIDKLVGFIMREASQERGMNLKYEEVSFILDRVTGVFLDDGPIPCPIKGAKTQALVDELYEREDIEEMSIILKDATEHEQRETIS